MIVKELKDILSNVSDEAYIYFIYEELDDVLGVVDISLTTSLLEASNDNLQFLLKR